MYVEVRTTRNRVISRLWVVAGPTRFAGPGPAVSVHISPNGAGMTLHPCEATLLNVKTVLLYACMLNYTPISGVRFAFQSRQRN